MMEDNIIFSLNEIENENSNNIKYIQDFLNEGEFDENTNYTNTMSKNDAMYSQMVNYKENYTINQLYQICEYYGIAKVMKLNRFKKEDVISVLVNYESNVENQKNVLKRKQMWYYINELKNDKFMKKYVLWNF